MLVFISTIVISDNNRIETRYGSPSGYANYVNYFESENYPGNYGNRIRALYLLYIPGATEIEFTFSTPFGLEENKDELYIGAGLEFNFDQLDLESDPSNQKYFFDGRTVPEPFTIVSDEVYMYFLSDRNNNDMIYEGFRVSWNVPGPEDSTPPVITGCPNNIVRNIELGAVSGTTATWTEPTATDDSGSATLTQRTNTPGSFFVIGTTQVLYVFSDPSGNSATCSFNVIILAGKCASSNKFGSI